MSINRLVITIPVNKLVATPIASVKAKFGQTFSRMGLVPGDGGPYFLTRILGHAKTMEMYLTGHLYSGEEAFKLGLVNELVDENCLYNKTLQLMKCRNKVTMPSKQSPRCQQATHVANDIKNHLLNHCNQH